MIVILKEDIRQLDYPLRVGATSELGLTSFTVIKRNRSNFKRNRVSKLLHRRFNDVGDEASKDTKVTLKRSCGDITGR